MPTTTYIIQDSNLFEIDIIDAATLDNSYLKYLQGGGTIFDDLQNDAVIDGGQWHQGNPVLTDIEIPVYKKCNKATIETETIKVEGATINRGLFIQKYTVDPDTISDGDTLKSNSTYFWDEVYTSPIGYLTAVSGTIANFQFNLSGNTLVLKTNDVNIIPKIGDYIVMQKVPSLYTKPTDIEMDPSSSPSAFAGIFTDGVSNLPVIFNTETYQVKITDVAFASPSGITTKYTLTLDKSLNVEVGDEYSFILLNRENTGLQKELFYDTFEQIEVNRQQLLGDPYNSTSTVKPKGRKNFLYYNNAQYLGLRNLLQGYISNNEVKLLDTPFVVYDIDEDIRDRFNPVASELGNYTFEFHLPGIMMQEDVDDKLNVLVNYGQVQTGEVGLYSGLYLKWRQDVSKRLGWVFYDLRLIVIDDPELVLALSYNSNRNYTLPKPIIAANGNTLTNPISAITLDVVGVQSNTFSPTVIIVNNKHGLKDGDVITIEGIRTKVEGSNLIHLSNVNGIRYIKRFYTDPLNPATEKLDRFYIYTDAGLTTSTPPDGTFVNAGIGQSGKIKGARLQYNYFFTYRVKNKRYDSILPYGELINFNFAKSETEAEIDNVTGNLYISLPPFTYLGNGYEIDDLEFIMGEWEAQNPEEPFKITGFKNVVVMSSLAITIPNSPSNIAPNTNYVININDYLTFVAATVNNTNGPYDFVTNAIGDPTYDIFNNFTHYNITTGSLPETLNTANGKWLIGNVKYKAQVEQYRSKIQIVVGADEWNDTTNPSYDPTNEFQKEKYISEVAICNPDSDKPLIYAKISPPVKKTNDLDILINLTIDW